MGQVRKKQFWIFYGIFLLLSAAILLSLYLHNTKKFIFQEHLQDTIFTVDDQKISLQEASFYLNQVEQKVSRMAKKYNPEDETQFWNVHFSAGMDSTFVRSMAKEAVYETCVYDYVMEKEAGEAGISLTEAERQQALSQAADYYKGMSQKAQSVTQLNQEQINVIVLRRALSKKYAVHLVQTADFAGFPDSREKELSYDGSYYTKMIKAKHVIDVNTKLWDEVTIGSLTI